MAFATSQDVARRLGRTFTDTETAQVDAILDLASLEIAAVCGRDISWVEGVIETPAAVKVVCVEVAVRVLSNPTGVRSRSEQLGQYALSESYVDQSATTGAGVALTDREERRVRKAVFGTTSYSVELESVATDLHPINILDLYYP